MGQWGAITRRRMLERAAASGAVTLLSPGRAWARPHRRAITTLALGNLEGETGAVAVPPGSAMVGVQWQSPRGPQIELRVVGAAGHPGPWVAAASRGHAADRVASAAGDFGEALWIGAAPAVQLRSPSLVEGVKLHFVRRSRAESAEVASAFPVAQPVLQAGAGQPDIFARRGWARGHAVPRGLAGYGTIEMAFVHHTVSPNGYRPSDVPGMLRGIFDYHRYVRGFLDIAYNFLIDAYGRIWEGRLGGIDMAVIGAHAGGYNGQSTGIAVLGDFAAVVPPPAALASLKRLLAWKLSLHGVPARGRATVVVDPSDASYTPFAPGQHVSLPRVAGHRDGDRTDCPGDALYHRLPAIRRRVIALAGTPAQLWFKAPSHPVLAGQAVLISGRLTLLDGTAVAGAPVELQQLHWKPNADLASAETTATVLTQADGSFSTSATFQHNAIVRGLHRPSPATVADWTQIAVAPALSLSVVSSSPLELSGTVTPAKRHVTVELFPAGQSRPVARRRVDGSPGAFNVSFGTPAPGSYEVVARVAATESNAAGASPPVTANID